MPCEFVDYTYWQPVIRISTNKNVLNKQITPSCVGHHAFFECVEFILRKVFVDVAPKDFICTFNLFDDRFVFGSPTGVFTGIYNQGAMVRKNTLVTTRDFFIKLSGVEIPV